MTNSKSTKRALISSALAVVICVAMLIGTTFAWFTDTASTGVNKIQAGTLKIDIVDENDESIKGKKISFVNKENLSDILWEPGATFKTTGFRIKNIGNLALKYKLALSGINGNNELLDVIKFSVVDASNKVVNLDSFEGHLTPDDSLSGLLCIQGHMDETAGNHYQGLSLEGLGITVYATQDTVENDSFGNTYDVKAEYPTYPAGLTKDSFTGNLKIADENGKLYSEFKEAMDNVADNGALYLKENETITFNTHLNTTKNITIYANGADFSGKDISIGTYAAPLNKETTINIYGAKNLVVWGQPTKDTNDCTWNVNFYNCENDGSNFLMYRGGEDSTAKINLTLTNCKANGFNDSIVHTTADGSINIKNCTFANNCAPVNIAHKQSGSMEVVVENSKFINCGKIDPSNDYFAPARFVNNSAKGSLNIELKNNTFTGTIGTNGDILLGDYRTGKPSNALTAIIETAEKVMVKASEAAAYEFTGGTITIS